LNTIQSKQNVLLLGKFLLKILWTITAAIKTARLC